MITKLTLEGYITDTIADFFYCDRKEDSNFTIEDAKNILELVSSEELKEMFCRAIDEALV